MVFLFCESDGRDAREDAISKNGKFEGEYTKVVSGLLLNDGYRCDKCNCPLDKNDNAFYISNFSNSIKDPKGEKDYFNMRTVNIEIF